jgi:hypothetical protein
MWQWIENVSGWLWRMGSPLRRPMVRKFDAHVARQLHRQIKPLVQVMSQQLVQLRELNLCAESTIRELLRLQMQLETGQVAVETAEEIPADWPRASQVGPDNPSQAA